MEAQLEILTTWGLGPEQVIPDIWERIAGMNQEKELIEKKVLWPLLHPELAAKHGVSTPKTILLFGPPGTGKSTFAKGIASRLSWFFIEVSPSHLLREGLGREALGLRQLFEELQRLAQCVIFFDEFEELALRPERAAVTEKMVSSEMLRQVPRFRTKANLLLICATNNIRLLNPPLLRVGRFDYILPIGPMDSEASRQVFELYLRRLNLGEIDFEAIAKQARYYTPADIEAVCAHVAQAAFEWEVTRGQDYRVTTQDLLSYMAQYKVTLTSQDFRQFEEDVEQFCRADYCRLLSVKT